MIYEEYKQSLPLGERLREEGTEGALRMTAEALPPRVAIDAEPFFAALEEAFHESIDTAARFRVRSKYHIYAVEEGLVALVTVLYTLMRGVSAPFTVTAKESADTLCLIFSADGADGKDRLTALPPRIAHAVRALAERMEISVGSHDTALTLTVPVYRAAVVASYTASKDLLLASVERTVQDIYLLEKSNR